MFHDHRLGDDAHDIQKSQTSNILLRLKYLRRKREMSFFLCDLHFLFSIKSNLTRITKDVVISSIIVFLALNSSQINQRMMTWIAVNDLLKDQTAGTKDNLVGFELNLVIRDQGHIRMFLFFIEIFEHQLKMIRECLPGKIILRHSRFFSITNFRHQIQYINIFHGDLKEKSRTADDEAAYVGGRGIKTRSCLVWSDPTGTKLEISFI